MDGGARLLDIFRRGTAEVDWCEYNYRVSPYIAEFYNTISNVLLFVYPPIMLCLFRDYAKYICGGSRLVWWLILLTAVGSTYFHATLSLAGQLLDELAILWAIICVIAYWTPKRHLSLAIRKHMSRFRGTLLGIAILLSFLSWFMPAINALALMTVSIPVSVVLVKEIRRSTNSKARKLGNRVIMLWIIAICIWTSDRVQCKMWRALHFPYLHAIWHVLIAIATYQACVLCAYFDAVAETLELSPAILFWPDDSWEYLGVPYVSVRLPSTSPTAMTV